MKNNVIVDRQTLPHNLLLGLRFDCASRLMVQVAGGPALTLLQDEELELLVCGLPHLDFDALEAAARYEGGFSVEHPLIRQFWAIVKSLPLEKKRRLLAFATGSDRCEQPDCASYRCECDNCRIAKYTEANCPILITFLHSA